MSDTQSESMSLNTTDYKKIAKGAAIAFAGTFLMSIATWLGTGQVDWSLFLKQQLPAAISVGINAAWKFIQGN